VQVAAKRSQCRARHGSAPSRNRQTRAGRAHHDEAMVRCDAQQFGRPERSYFDIYLIAQTEHLTKRARQSCSFRTILCFLAAGLIRFPAVSRSVRSAPGPA